ncbi:ABC transporter [Bombiscardovia apis]|uniref:ABC transporter n=1 Tax=Bombiscardovia apis TaxID=2932182 RepID=A0ABN6SG44_9BIFI|nr:ABC transporter permease [Bombiscardovia apis]BDR54959.1 ABC transporter [Bombiscardovia apis]
MINQMRADLYRQSRTKGLYILLALTIALSVLITASKQVGGVMVTDEDLGKQMTEMTQMSWSALTGVKAMTMSSSLLMYFYIGLFVIVVGYEFSQKTYKNTLISGISRLQFIAAKYVVLLVDLLVLSAIYYAASIITSLIAGRGIGESWGTLLSDTAVMTIAIAFFMSVIFSLAIILLMATGSTIIPAVFVIIWPIAVAMLTFFAHWSWLKYVDFVTVAQNVSLSIITSSQLWPYIGVSLGILALTIVGSALIIRNKEL